MIKKCCYVMMIGASLCFQNYGGIFFGAGSLQAETIEGGKKEIDGLKVMTMVSERDRGKDYIISTSWKLTEKGSERHRAKYTEARKHYKGKDGFNYKSVIRYSEPPKINRRAILTWNHTDGERTYWYYFVGFLDPKRANNIERIRTQAEVDFNLDDYVDINLEEETHKLIRSEEYKGKTCYVVESIPIRKEIKYGKRISWIDQQNWLPLKVEYFDGGRKNWKVLSIKWQSISGLWFWKEAVAENIQKDNKTFITIEDVKVNLSLEDREFGKVALQKRKY